MGMVVQYPHMHRQAQLVVSLSIPVTLAPWLLLDLWQQLNLAASTKSFQQLVLDNGGCDKCSRKCCSLHFKYCHSSLHPPLHRLLESSGIVTYSSWLVCYPSTVLTKCELTSCPPLLLFQTHAHYTKQQLSFVSHVHTDTQKPEF